ncbi:unnamed protein product, partial [Prorocentrum cordatum]
WLAAPPGGATPRDAGALASAPSPRPCRTSTSRWPKPAAAGAWARALGSPGTPRSATRWGETSPGTCAAGAGGRSAAATAGAPVTACPWHPRTPSPRTRQRSSRPRGTCRRPT